MKKALGQTVRDIKREVNKKVLKVPGIEQKVLDATSNEAWGPHGSYLADIAQATRNSVEYQLIMSVLWKRLNDTGKNWRHVYKALIVLEYLVAHGSERVINEIKEHAYQISALSDFQYIDSSGRDQGNNVRKKSQSLVSLVNDKERIQEARQKAFANRDKYRPASAGGIYRPGSGGYGDRYDDDSYGYREDDRNGYGKEREWSHRGDDRNSRGGDIHDGDTYGRDLDERYKDGYRDDDYRRNHGNDDYQYGTRNRSFDREKERAFDDDDRYSSRGLGSRADGSSPDQRLTEHKPSELSHGAPPSYEEVVQDAGSRIQDERNGGPPAPAPEFKTSSLTANAIEVRTNAATHMMSSSPTNDGDSFDEFDPRASATAAPPVPVTGSHAEKDLFLMFSDSVSPSPQAVVPATANSEAGASTASTFLVQSSASVLNQNGEDPFGDGPFKAVVSDGAPPQQSHAPANNFPAQSNIFASVQNMTSEPQIVSLGSNLASQPQNFVAENTFVAQPRCYPPSNSFSSQLPTHTAIPNEFVQPQNMGPTNINSAVPQSFAPANNFTIQPQNIGPTTFHSPTTIETSATLPSNASNIETVTNLNFGETFQGNAYAPGGLSNVEIPSTLELVQTEVSHLNSAAAPVVSHGPAASISRPLLPLSGPSAKAQSSNDKFELKSNTVWSDTLSRGLVNLNISGPKTNPLADIGIDFESINRKEKRNEKNPVTPATSTTAMGKAMGSGSGIGRTGATAPRPSSNPNLMTSHGMPMGMGGGAVAGLNGNFPGMGMGNYGAGMNQPVGMGMGMAGMGLGVQMNTSMGMAPPGPRMPSGYNPMMMGMRGNSPQPPPPYGGYR